ISRNRWIPASGVPTSDEARHQLLDARHDPVAVVPQLPEGAAADHPLSPRRQATSCPSAGEAGSVRCADSCAGRSSGVIFRRLSPAAPAMTHCVATKLQNITGPDVMTADHAIVTSVDACT